MNEERPDTLEELDTSAYEEPIEAANEELAQNAPEEPLNDAGQPIAEPAVDNTPVVEEPSQPNVDAYNQYANAMDLSRYTNQIDNLTAQNQQLMQELETLRQSQEMNAQRINENVAEAMSEPPAWDDDAYAYASDAERAKIRSEYDSKMLDYASRQAEQRLMDRLKPMLDQYEANNANMEFDNSLRQLSEREDFDDIGGRTESIKKLAARPEFNAMPSYQRAVITTLVSRGLDYRKPQKMDDETLAEEAFKNPNVMRMISEKQARMVQEQNNVPVFSTSNGLSSAAFPSRERPERLEDLY